MHGLRGVEKVDACCSCMLRVLLVLPSCIKLAELAASTAILQADIDAFCLQDGNSVLAPNSHLAAPWEAV